MRRSGPVARRRARRCKSLNTTPGYTPPQAYGSFVPSAPSPVTEALTNWICSAPNLPFRLDGKKVTDPHNARRTLTSSNFDRQWPIKTCSAIDQFPPIQSPASADFALLEHPVPTSQIPPGVRSPRRPSNPIPLPALRPWTGRRPATTASTSPACRTPTASSSPRRAQSVDAALASARHNADGTLSFRARARLPGAYPMASVIYAVVPTDP